MEKQIATARLTLRPLSADDLQTTHAYAGDAETGKYMMFLPKRTPEETAQFIEGAAREWEKDNPAFLEYAVCLEGVHIGGVSLYISEDGSEAELGWIFEKQYQGKGYASEAAQALAQYALRVLHIPRLVAHCDVRNLPSRRVMEKLGMTQVSVGKRVYPEGSGKEPSEEYMYELCTEASA